jgi:hypothetical protein
MRITEVTQEPVNEAPLAPGLFKYEGTPKARVPIVIQKIQSGSPFKVKTTQGVEDVVIDPAEADRFSAWTQTSPRPNLKLKTAEEPPREIPLGSIIKTAEFGGEESGKRVAIEQLQIDGLSGELEAIKQKLGKSSIPLKIGKRVVQAATFGKTTELINGRAPKSDMTVYDENGHAVAWVSLKADNFAKYGGWNHLINLPEIQQWLSKIKAETGGVFQSGQAFGLHPSNDIKNLVVFGKNFFSGQPGISNVDVVLAGYPKIAKSGRGYQLTAQQVFANGDTPSGDYEPYLVLRYMLDRPDVGFKNARAETNTKFEKRKVKFLD